MALKLYYFVLYFVLAVYISLINGDIINIKHNSAAVSLRFILILLLDTKMPVNILSLHLFDWIKRDNNVIWNIVEPFIPRDAERHYFIENVGRRVEINCIVSAPVLA